MGFRDSGLGLCSCLGFGYLMTLRFAGQRVGDLGFLGDVTDLGLRALGALGFSFSGCYGFRVVEAQGFAQVLGSLKEDTCSVTRNCKQHLHCNRV